MVNSRLGRSPATGTRSRRLPAWQSRTGRTFTGAGTPSSEGTGPSCRVPWQRVPRSPEEGSPRLPVSVCGTGATRLPSGFSCRYGLITLGPLLRGALAIPAHRGRYRSGTTGAPSACGFASTRLPSVAGTGPATSLDEHGQQLAATSPPGPHFGVARSKDRAASRGGTGLSTRCPSPTLPSQKPRLRPA